MSAVHHAPIRRRLSAFVGDLQILVRTRAGIATEEIVGWDKRTFCSAVTLFIHYFERIRREAWNYRVIQVLMGTDFRGRISTPIISRVSMDCLRGAAQVHNVAFTNDDGLVDHPCLKQDGRLQKQDYG